MLHADKADILNTSLFVNTAKRWRTENPSSKGNVRDGATI
jgi:hypothetical protein